jgi:hypothetical protein
MDNYNQEHLREPTGQEEVDRAYYRLLFDLGVLSDHQDNTEFHTTGVPASDVFELQKTIDALFDILGVDRGFKTIKLQEISSMQTVVMSEERLDVSHEFASRVLAKVWGDIVWGISGNGEFACNDDNLDYYIWAHAKDLPFLNYLSEQSETSSAEIINSSITRRLYARWQHLIDVQKQPDVSMLQARRKRLDSRGVRFDHHDGSTLGRRILRLLTRGYREYFRAQLRLYGIDD